MPSNEDAHPEYSGLKKVRTGFHVAGYLTRKLASGLTLGLVSKGIQRAADAIRGYKQIPKKETTTFDVGGQNVELPKSFMGKKIPPGKTFDSLKQEVQDKLYRGERLLHDIDTGHAPKQCSQQNMTDIMAYLQARAQAGYGNFEEGSMTIPDPGGKIKNFLDTSPEAYQRNSSHVAEFQRQEGGKGTHRGIDAYGRTRNTDEMLPNGMKSLMYGSLNKDAEGLKMPEDRLWMKMEPHGAWAFSPKVNDPNGPRRAANSHDGKAAVGHALSFIETRGQGSKEGTRKERIPDDLKDQWKQIQKLARKELQGKNPPEEITNMLREGEGLQTARGVRFINSYLDTLKNHGDLSPELRTEADRMQKRMGERFPKDTMDKRIGNEAILTKKDMRPRKVEDIPVPGHREEVGQKKVKGIGSLGKEAASKAQKRVH